jgi:hypothetical protein
MDTNDDLDGPWKLALERYLPECLALVAPSLHRRIDWSRRFTFLDTQLAKVAGPAGSGPRVVDKLVQVHPHGSGEALVLLHVELQNQRQTDFAKRMYRYYARLTDHFQEPVTSIAILGDTSKSWRPDRYHREFWGCELEYRFPIVKLSDFAPGWADLEANRNPFAAIVMAHLAASATKRRPGQRVSAKLAQIRRLYDLGYDADGVRSILQLVDWILSLPNELDDRVWRELAQIEAEKGMSYVTSFERIGLKRGLEKGLKQGQELGLEQGREQGREQGLVQGKAEVLADWLLAAFGDAARPVAARVRTLSDAAQLEAIREALAARAPLQDVLRIASDV